MPRTGAGPAVGRDPRIDLKGRGLTPQAQPPSQVPRRLPRHLDRLTAACAGHEATDLVRLEADPEKSIAEGSDADNASELSCAALRNIG